MKKQSILFILFLFCTNIIAQDNIEQIKILENSIYENFENIYFSNDDSIKEYLSIENIKLFEQILDYNESWDYDFKKLEKRLSIIKSDDELVKITTWNIFFNNGTYKYFGFIQHRKKTTQNFKYFILNDKSAQIANPKTDILDDKEWFGALYYKIITNIDGNKTYYTLLGWDGNNDLSTKKIIEVLSFNTLGKPKFGFSFSIYEQECQRIIFEYNQQAKMTLLFDENTQMLIFDYLVPINPKYEGIFQFYGPSSSSYDALYFELGKWNFKQDVDFRNPEK